MENMETVYNGNSLKSGVYKITNKINGKVYIGSAKEFKERYKGHLSSLRNNKHCNKHLQASFNKYGENAFVFEVIEVVDGTKLDRTKREQECLNEFLIDESKWDLCFNLRKNTIQDQGPWSKNPEVTKAKISKSKKEFYQTKEGKALIQKLSDDKRGKSYEEYYGVEKAAEVKAKIRENKLIEMNKSSVKNNLRRLLTGVSYEERFGVEKAAEINAKKSLFRKGKYFGDYKTVNGIKLISPDGTVYTKIVGIKDFALKHKLSPNHFSELLAQKRKSHKGWKLLIKTT